MRARPQQGGTARLLRLGDRYLLLALGLAAALVLHGIWWGWVEEWHPDSMALRHLLTDRRHFLEPGEFLKPPFHTYLNFFLSVLPLKFLERVTQLATGRPQSFAVGMLYWSRLIQIALFMGMVWLTYRVVLRASTPLAARGAALLAATSAGFVLQAHFLTADIPLTLWMLASFACAQAIVLDARLRNYLFAGLLAGVATATKYNGLAVALAIPIFHWFANGNTPWLRLAVDKRLIVGVLMVIAGFVLTNPYSALDFPKFSRDFAYNYVTTPVYGGETTGSSYGTFLLTIPEIVGWPVVVATLAGLVFSVARWRRASLIERATLTAALGVFLLYYFKFAAAPRMEVRFVLPIVPLLWIAAAGSWSAFARKHTPVAVGVAAVLLAYNVAASYWVGKRFAEDPRMAAQSWAAAHIPSGSPVESSPYTPHWNLFPGIQVGDVRMPAVSGRNRLFAQALSDSWAARDTQRRESDEGLPWYQFAALAQRKPAFVALDSAYTDRYVNEEEGELYPEMRAFFTALYAGQLGYHIVLDRASRGSPVWLYPREMDFVDNRVVILQRDAAAR
jgi:Dolichyl-phosphate-mannose-protein mannosyltransferase